MATHHPHPHPSDVRDGRQPYFFKVFFPCHSSKRLGIPPGFVKHIKHEISRGVSLIGPSGNVWNVHLVRDNDGGIAFQNGWEDFVADHTLKSGDFLLFRYDGGQCFTVVVFDPTACEKEEVFHAMPSEEVLFLGETCQRQCISKCLAEDLIVLDPKMDMTLLSENMGGREDALDLEATCQDSTKKHTNSLESYTEEWPHANYGSMVANEDNMDGSSEQDTIVNSNKRHKDVSTDICGLHSELNLGHSLGKVALSSSRYPLWEQSFHCHVDRAICEVKEEPQSDQDISSTYFQESMMKLTWITKSEANKLQNLCGGNFKSIQKHKELAVERSTHKKKRNQMKQHHHEHSRNSPSSDIDDVWTRVQRKHAVSRRRPVTEDEKAKTLEAALLFQSEHPSGICVMRDSYVYYGFYLCLPRSFTKHMPKSHVKMELWDPNNKPWNVLYINYKGRGGFSAGWGKFARSHSLESDDVCIFELLKPHEVRVHIFRVVEQHVPLNCGVMRIEKG